MPLPKGRESIIAFIINARNDVKSLREMTRRFTAALERASCASAGAVLLAAPSLEAPAAAEEGEGGEAGGVRAGAACRDGCNLPGPPGR